MFTLVVSITPLSFAADFVPATRAEVLQSIILAQTPNIPAVRNSGEFADVPPGHPFEMYLLYAIERGIIQPDTDGLLHPYQPVSRVELLAMLARTWKLTSPRTSPYKDVPEGSWYEPYAGLAATYHLLQTSTPDKLEPESPVSQADVDRALVILQTFTRNDSAGLRLDDGTTATTIQPALYTVSSVRRQKVKLVAAEEVVRLPFIRRTAIPLSVADQRTAILQMVNAIRQEHGLKPLMYDKRLEASAQEYADRMARDGFFAHIDPEGKEIRDRMKVSGYYDRSFSLTCNCLRGFALGENLAKGQKSAKEAVDDWMKSTEHRAAMLNPVYTDTGIGLNAGIWVQHFGAVILP